MTPLISSILSTTSQALIKSAGADFSSTGDKPFESFLNGAIQANNNSKEIKELATKDARTNNYISLTNNELATKDLIISSSDSEIITSSDKTIDELTTEKNNSEFVDAQLMMASAGQQQLPQQRSLKDSQSIEDSAATSAEHPPLELKIRSYEHMLASKINSLAIDEKMVDQKISSSLDSISINADQLAQLQAKLGTSAEQSFAFLTKDQSDSSQFNFDNQMTPGTNTSGIHFGEHLNKVTPSILQNTSAAQTQTLQTPFQSPNWGHALSQRVTWMIKDQLQNASITINPPHLGQIEVRLQTNQLAQTSVYFMSNNPEVRQVITENLSTLRELMSQNGLQLGQADVGSRESSHSAQYGAPSRKKEEPLNGSVIDISTTESSQKIGLINTYA